MIHKQFCHLLQICAVLGTTAMVSTGCADPQETVAVQAVAIKPDTFCDVMRGLYPPKGIPSWDTADTRPTIDSVRRIESAVVKTCVRPATKPPTS